MNIDMDMLTPILIALIGAGGLWQLLSLKVKQNHEAMMEDRAGRNEFNETLKMQVDRLADQVNTLVTEKEELLKTMGDLKAELASAQATIKSLQESMMRK